MSLASTMMHVLAQRAEEQPWCVRGVLRCCGRCGGGGANEEPATSHGSPRTGRHNKCDDMEEDTRSVVLACHCFTPPSAEYRRLPARRECASLHTSCIQSCLLSGPTTWQQLAATQEDRESAVATNTECWRALSDQIKKEPDRGEDFAQKVALEKKKQVKTSRPRKPLLMRRTDNTQT